MKMQTVGFLIIGNEILSGRTTEKNLSVLAALLAPKGLRVDEVRVVRDVPTVIAKALQEMQITHNYVLTSGGIGPTHDDVTTYGVALAFNTEVIENLEALALLEAFYDGRGLEFTTMRRRMAQAPRGATPLKSEFPGAPGYRIENVFVCAGVPAIFKQMATAAALQLPDLPPRRSLSLRVMGPESEFAEQLEAVQAQWPSLEIGSYPRDDNGVLYCHLVFGGVDEKAIRSAAAKMTEYLRCEMSFEVTEIGN
jgi:molybdopterin-biosynthesis enzyme MoeA-like protein